MSYTFKKITDTETLEKAPDGATVVCEVDGEIKRVPAIGMEGGIKVANIRAVPDENSGITFSCDNMTYEEAVDYLTNRVPFLIFISSEETYTIAVLVAYDGTSVIDIMTAGGNIEWTSAGFANAGPGPGPGPKAGGVS